MLVLPMMPPRILFFTFLLTQFVFPWSLSFMRIDKTEQKLLLLISEIGRMMGITKVQIYQEIEKEYELELINLR